MRNNIDNILKEISQSKIKMWKRCPRQWEFRYIKGLIIPPKGFFVQGSAYHGALKENFKYKLDKKSDMPIDDVLDAYDTYWNLKIQGKSDKEEKEDTGIGLEEIDWENDKPDELKDQGSKLVKLYHQRIAPLITPVRVEDKLSVKINDETSLIGYLDLERKEDVIDHKLLKRRMNQDDADKDDQTYMYLFLGKKKDFYYHCAIKKNLPEVDIVKVTKKVKDLKWWLRGVFQMIEQMKTGVCPPNTTGWHCNERFCGYYSLCHKM